MWPFVRISRESVHNSNICDVRLTCRRKSEQLYAVGQNSRALLLGPIDPKQSVQMERRAVGGARQGMRAGSLDYTSSTAIELFCRYAIFVICLMEMETR